MTRALSGIRVLDLAGRSAALAGRILADLGAEVILVEPPGGSPIRAAAPFLDGVDRDEASFSHQYFSANKRSVMLDVAADRAAFLGLVASADVLIDTARPAADGFAALQDSELRRANPALIHCSVTPFGLHGEWRERKATDLVACAAAGLVWLSGEPKGRPVQGGATV